MSPTPLELTESLLNFCRAHRYPAPPLQMEALELCRTALVRSDITKACRHAAEIVIGSIPWHEPFDCVAPEPLEHEDPVYAKAVFYALLLLWKRSMIELQPPLCNCCQRPKSLSWHCERVQHK
jgi:hypothetical protein